MKRIILVMLFASLMLSGGYAQVGIGDEAPHFKLLNTDYTLHSLSDYQDQKGLIIIFTCNHCPYAKLYEERITKLHDTYVAKGYPVVAINPNDSIQYKSDGFSYMVGKGYKFPYLLDNKGVYKAYGALKTPHAFVLSNHNNVFKVAYIGAIDDSPQDEKQVKVNYLEDAVVSLISDKQIDPSLTKAVGCSIKPF